MLSCNFAAGAVSSLRARSPRLPWIVSRCPLAGAWWPYPVDDQPPIDTDRLGDLLDRMRAGDLAARDELFRAIAMQMERQARRMLRGFPSVRKWEQTGDILQRTSLRLIETLKKVRPEDTRQFFALTAELMRRVLLDLARKMSGPGGIARHITPPGQDSRAADREPAAPVDSPEELDDWAAFHAAVAKLPREEREVVGLRHYHGLGQAEVAKMLGMGVRTVARRWKTAMVALKRKLRND